MLSQSRFPVLHKVGNVDIFVLPKFENKLHTVISDIYFILMYLDQFHFTVKLFQLITIYILFSLETAQKCQHCVLRENSNDAGIV